MPWNVLLLILLFAICDLHAFNPVVLVPGLGGSQLQAKLNKTNSGHFICAKRSDWYTIWLQLYQIGVEECMVENMELFINETDGTTKNQEGVEIRVTKFGDTDTVEWLDPFHPIGTRSRFAYFNKIVESLLGLSYVRNVSIRGAPYDFRKAPNEMSDFSDDLTDLIENTYEINNNSRVVLIGHSMGNNHILFLLNRKSPRWKDKYVEAFISIAAPWAGAVKPLKLIASGDSLGLPSFIMSPLRARALQRSMVSTSWLMPSQSHWKSDDVLVMSPHRNYTSSDYDQFFRDVNFKKGILLRKNTEYLIKKLISPGVRTYCLIGLNKIHDTPIAYDYRNSRGDAWYDDQPETVMGPGDGTVNERSLRACQDWKETVLVEFDDAEHQKILSDDRVANFITNLIGKL